MSSLTHSVQLAELPLLISVQAPMFAPPSLPPSPRLTAETNINSVTSYHRASKSAARRKKAKRSPFKLSVSPGQAAPRVSLALPDDLEPTPYPSLARDRGEVDSHASVPTPLRGESLAPASSTELESESSDSGSDNSSELSEELSEIQGIDLIPKPQGEAGRPGRGGYNIFAELRKNPELGWTELKLGQVKVRTAPFEAHSKAELSTEVHSGARQGEPGHS